MASSKDLPEFDADDILCDFKSSMKVCEGFSNLLVGYNKVLKQTVAIKVFRHDGTPEMESLAVKDAKEEGKYMHMARHENVVEVFGYVKLTSAFGIVMEYCECGSLLQLSFNPNIHLQPGLYLRILTQLAAAITFLHNLPGQYLIHSNLKPSNILLTKNLHAKICDIGSAKQVEFRGVSERGTDLKPQFMPQYTTPNLMKSKEIDDYIFAIMIYVMFSGKSYLYDLKLMNLLIMGWRPKLKKIYQWMQSLNTKDKEVVQAILEMMMKCWDEDPSKHPSMTELADLLQKLLDEQDKSALLQQEKFVVKKIHRKKLNFTNLDYLVPISSLRYTGPLSRRDLSSPEITSLLQKLQPENLQKSLLQKLQTSTGKTGFQESDASDSVASTSVELISVYDDMCASAKVGKGGGTIEVGSCKVIIPPNALLEEVEIEISVYYQEADGFIRLTPLLSCKPHGLTFEKKIEIILPTFYRAESDALSVAVQRAKDEFSGFETIGNDFLHHETQCFEFSTDQFSLFEYILSKASNVINLLREKVLIFGVSPDPTDVPMEIDSSVLVCNDIKSAKELNNMNKVLETDFFLRYGEQQLDLQLTGEDLDPLTSTIRDARCKRDETHFALKKKQQQGLDK